MSATVVDGLTSDSSIYTPNSCSIKDRSSTQIPHLTGLSGLMTYVELMQERV